MMKYTNKQIWLINYPVMLSIGMEQLMNLTDAIFLGHVGTTELGASAIAGLRVQSRLTGRHRPAERRAKR